jgi:hypothetical protein
MLLLQPANAGDSIKPRVKPKAEPWDRAQNVSKPVKRATDHALSPTSLGAWRP